MLRVENISKTYDNGVRALNEVSFTIEKGKLHALLGTNGAGKSTLIYLFLDFIRPDSGRTFVDEFCVQETPQAAKHLVAYLPDEVQLFPDMRTLECLSFFAKLAGTPSQRDDCERLMDRVRLSRKWADEKVKHLSRGMRQKLNLACALSRNVDNFLLDEPTVGLDAQSCLDLAKVLAELRDDGATLLMATHDLLRAQQLADTVGILHKGDLIRQFQRSEIEHDNLDAIYLECLDHA